MENSVGEIIDQITVNKEIIYKSGYYEKVEDFKLKNTSDIAEDVKRYFNEEKGLGLSLGFETLDVDDHFKARRGEVTILTGSSGSGKTTFLSQVLLNLMTYTNVLVASMEMRPVSTHVRGQLQETLGQND